MIEADVEGAEEDVVDAEDEAGEDEYAGGHHALRPTQHPTKTPTPAPTKTQAKSASKGGGKRGGGTNDPNEQMRRPIIMQLILEQRDLRIEQDRIRSCEFGERDRV